MSPDFLLRYLSIQPFPAKAEPGSARHLPIAVDVAAVGLIPLEVKTTVEKEIKAAEKLPKYMRIRKIRDLVNEARSAHETDLHGPLTTANTR
ncbi:MAG TPA: hypothetical protein VGR14_02645 [Verrucomicrobiae bacterium]|jgi:hypothetical protein|nr:hypothetical protein [Verrucomicrobiae bacterium]